MALRWFSTLLFLVVLAAGAFGPHALTLCPTLLPTDPGPLTDAALDPTAPRLAFALADGVLLADRETLARTSFWSMPGVTAMTWTPDGALLLALDGQGDLHAIDAAHDRIQWSTTIPPSASGGWLFKPALGLGALTPISGGLWVFRLSDGTVVDDPGLTSTAFWADCL